MILGRYQGTVVGLNLNISECVIEAGDVPLKGSTATIIDLGMYKFKYLNTGKFTPK